MFALFCVFHPASCYFWHQLFCVVVCLLNAETQEVSLSSQNKSWHWCYSTTVFKTNIVIPSLSCDTIRQHEVRIFINWERWLQETTGEWSVSQIQIWSAKRDFLYERGCQKVSRQVSEMLQLNGNRDKLWQESARVSRVSAEIKQLAQGANRH